VNKIDRARLAKIKSFGCLACAQDGRRWQSDAHHVVSNGYRRLSGGHQNTISLCPWHHRGLLPDGYTTSRATAEFGPSLAVNKREFVNRYGTERQLLAKINAKLDRIK
jgi:hypothetical protein